RLFLLLICFHSIVQVSGFRARLFYIKWGFACVYSWFLALFFPILYWFPILLQECLVCFSYLAITRALHPALIPLGCFFPDSGRLGSLRQVVVLSGLYEHGVTYFVICVVFVVYRS